MKTKLTKILLLLSFTAVITLIHSCKLKDPLEGFTVAVKTDVVSASHVFRVVDAKSGFSKKEFDNVTVTLSGPGAANLYDADGKKSFKIVQGRIGICIRKGVNPSISNPIVFNMNFDIPGYLTKTETFSLTSLMPTFNTIAIVNLNDLPSGASKKDTVISVPVTGTTQPITISTASSTGKPETTTITLFAGTKFTTLDGTPVGGEITSQILHTIPKNSEDYKMGINTPFNTNFIDKDGNLIKRFVIENEMIDLKFFASGKALLPVKNDGEIIIESYIGGDIIASINPFPFPSLINDITGAIAAATVSQISATCNTIPIDVNVMNYNQFGSLYEFRKHQTSLGVEVSSTEITPNENGTISTEITEPNCPITVKIQYKKRNEQTWLDADINGTIGTITLPPEPVNNTLKVYFGVNCILGPVSRPILPAGTVVYIIDNQLYLNTPNPVRGGDLIYPEDDAVGNVRWQRYTVKGTETKNGRVWNIIEIPKNELQAGVTYRASYYRASTRVDSDVDNPDRTPLRVPDNFESINDIEFEMDVDDCN
ncbi:MAG: hypothetical protein ACK4K9_03015 [Bacteroidia bacterium]